MLRPDADDGLPLRLSAGLSGVKRKAQPSLSGMMPAPRKSGILPGHLAQDAFPADDFFHADALAAARADGAGDVVLFIAHVPFFA